MSVSVALCDECSTIRFDPAWLSDRCPRQRRSVKSIRRNKNCAFCRLLCRAMFEEQRMGEYRYGNSNDVTWEWSDHVGPSGGFWLMTSFWSRISICFGVPPILDEPDEPLNSAYSLLSRRSTVISADRVKGWIKRCLEGHGAECGKDVDEEKRQSRRSSSGSNRSFSAHIQFVFPGLETLRVIDVERMCLVELGTLQPYVCLSYVRGSTAALHLTQANMGLLMEEESLLRVKELIPTTIVEAIHFCSKIGQQFLWVDSLCLIQNDPRDVKLGIEVMDLIYEKANLTIIMASGDNASSGLPGVYEGTRMPSKPLFEVAPGVQLGIHIGLEQHLAASTYRTRAWTFQEEALSKRALCFVGDTVFFRCQKTTYSEDCLDEVCELLPRPDNTSQILPRKNHPFAAVEAFGDALALYTKRLLTDQNDALNAMAGIIRRFSSMLQCGFLEGLPTAIFDNYILFHRQKGHLRRRPSFPSYSWTGWIGPIECPEIVNLNTWLTERTWIIWYKRRQNRPPTFVWNPEVQEYSDHLPRYRAREPFRPRVPLPFSVARNAPIYDIELEGPLPPYPILQFWTLTVYYEIGHVDVLNGEGALFDYRGNKCGYALLDGYEENPFFANKDEPYECLVLSETEKMWMEKKWRGEHAIVDELGSHELGSMYEQGNEIWPFYNVMLVQRDQDIVTRCGLGVVYQKAIDRSFEPGPCWREIFLA